MDMCTTPILDLCRNGIGGRDIIVWKFKINK
jgi:hypothetical protein